MKDLDGSLNTGSTAKVTSIPKVVTILLIFKVSPRGSMAEHVTRNDEIGGSTPPAGLYQLLLNIKHLTVLSWP